MAMGPSRWKVVTPSEFPWEQEAFDYIRGQVPDREAAEGREARPGIVAALTRGQIEGVDAVRLPAVDRAVMNAVSRGMEQAGIRQSERYRLISDYRLKQLPMEGHGWQDWEGV